MSKIFLQFASFAILFFIASKAQNDFTCIPSTCGNIEEIKFPFSLKTDPQYCGDPSYELECNKNQTIMIINSRSYLVQSISYSNLTIRLVDPVLATPNNTCITLPDHYTGYDEIGTTIFDDFIPFNNDVTFVNCDAPLNSSSFFESPFCGTSSNSSQGVYSYVAIGEDFRVSELGESCSTVMVASGSSYGPLNDATSLDGIKNGLAYGFELSWYRFFCASCKDQNGFCSIDGNEVTCQINCLYGVPLSEQGIDCRIERIGDVVTPYMRIGIGSLIGLRFACGITLLVVLIVYKYRKKHLAMDERIEDFLQNQNMLGPINYSSSEIKRMTNNLRDKLGQGAYGTVYKGKLQSGQYVAVKITSKFVGSEEEFVNEVATIGRIHHVNVVQLVGFCIEGPEHALVYEFMVHGSLEKYISKAEEGDEKETSLSYKKINEISLGVARGIDYLHRGCDMQILHFDIKPHNILLDENFNPKISDFGLAKLYPSDQSFVSLTGVRGTMGYMAPELFYKNIGGISYKADVYSFGMLLIEIAARRKTINPIEEHLTQAFFRSWIFDQLSQGKEIEIVDGEEGEKEMVKKMIMVALWCIQMSPGNRPAMNKVVEMLEGDVEGLKMPPRPFLAPRGIAEDHGAAIAKPALVTGLTTSDNLKSI
ncbi:hypothetical protein LIER_12600 [Lithospermum erythrorhizon]|uniref:non-specific serine/threonine protein kinase n=1 Tax=Lithospermum erythrorhizon TaxID=34254 RepID=A0AAV3PSH7_LITER